MKVGTLYCLSTLTAVWAAPGGAFSSPASSDTAPLQSQSLAQTVGQVGQTNADMQQYCPAAFFEHLAKVKKATDEFRAESPNNKMLYDEFRDSVLARCLTPGTITDAVISRQDPELLKTFHLEFTDEKLANCMSYDGLGCDTLEFLHSERNAERLEAKAVQSLRTAMADMDAAKKAREEAEEKKIEADREMTQYGKKPDKIRNQPEVVGH